MLSKRHSYRGIDELTKGCCRVHFSLPFSSLPIPTHPGELQFLKLKKKSANLTTSKKGKKRKKLVPTAFCFGLA